MKANYIKPIQKGLFALLLIFSVIIPAWAQTETETEEEYNSEDTTSATTEEPGYFDMGSGGSKDSDDGSTTSLRPKFQRRAYDRFVPPFDTITGLITYLSVVEILDQDGVEIFSDSIYKRAQRWLEAEFGKKAAKDFTKSSGPNKEGEGYKMVVEGRFPLYVQMNDFNKIPSGEVEFVMEIRVKEGRYRYKINNLVHIEAPLMGTKDERRTYFEFYKSQKENVKQGDQILIAADKHIHTMITKLYETCKEPIFVDEDDW